MTLEVSYNVYRRIIQFSKLSDKPIPILRYKLPDGISKGDVIKIRSIQMTSRTKTLMAKVVDIKEYDVNKDNIPYDELKPIYEDYVDTIPKLKRVVIVYVKPINF
jgi:hypothetical protein